LNLKKKDKWEEIVPKGSKVHLKRMGSSCLRYEYKGQEFIFIVGGINSLNNETNDILIYNEQEESFERINNSLPYKCSFNQNSFNLLSSGFYATFTSDSLLLQYEIERGLFFEIREK
jgi:hypothetical protein